MSADVEQAARLLREMEQAKVTAELLPLPNERDKLAEQVTLIYTAGDDAERAKIRAAGTAAELRLMLPFADRMAVLAVRDKNPALIATGLLAHAIEDFQWDPRENLRSLSLLFHSAAKLGIDAATSFREAARSASASSKHYFLDFADDPTSITAMGAREVQGPGGFDYESD